MTMLTSSNRLPRLRDSADEETMGTRPAWDRALFDQIARDLARPPPRSIHVALMPVSLAPPPNPFETPRLPSDPPPLWLTMPPAAPARPRRSIMPFVALAMIAAIAAALFYDPAARADVMREVRSAGAHASAAVDGPLRAVHLR